MPARSPTRQRSTSPCRPRTAEVISCLALQNQCQASMTRNTTTRLHRCPANLPEPGCARTGPGDSRVVRLLPVTASPQPHHEPKSASSEPRNSFMLHYNKSEIVSFPKPTAAGCQSPPQRPPGVVKCSSRDGLLRGPLIPPASVLRTIRRRRARRHSETHRPMFLVSLAGRAGVSLTFGFLTAAHAFGGEAGRPARVRRQSFGCGAPDGHVADVGQPQVGRA